MVRLWVGFGHVVRDNIGVTDSCIMRIWLLLELGLGLNGRVRVMFRFQVMIRCG